MKRKGERRRHSAQRDEAFKAYDTLAKEVEIKKDELIDQVQARLEQKVKREHLFTIRWRVD